MPITTTHLTYLFHSKDSSSALSDINCKFPDKSITLLIGANGSGKTTLLKLLSGLIRPSRGTIYYDKESLWNHKRLHSSLLKKMGFTFQYPEHQLFSNTVQGEFLYSMQPYQVSKSNSLIRIHSMLEQMGIPSSMMTKSPFIISTGQKRRIALGTTFVTEPDWLFLDEPTAGLDPQAVQYLFHYLMKRKQEFQGGTVIATHDLDALLPIADQIMILEKGRLMACLTPQELVSNISLLQNIGVSESIKTYQLLQEIGIHPPKYPISAKEMATSILKINSDQKGTQAVRSTFVSKQTLKTIHEEPKTTTLVNTTLAYKLDPRSKWFFYMMISSGILLQNHTRGLLISTLLTVFLLFSTKSVSATSFSVIKPFAYFMLISTLLSGIQFQVTDTFLNFSWIKFSLGDAVTSLQQLFKIFLVMLLGIVFTTTTSQLQMKQGLEKSLHYFTRFGLPVEAFSLGCTLLLRFIPIILNESHKFSMIVRARGKAPVKPGNIRIRDLPVITIPMLFAILRLGEELSQAMEARGYKKLSQKRTKSFELHFAVADYGILLTAGLLFWGLYSLRGW